MSDLISRQAAIDALGNGAMVNYQASGDDNGLVKAISVIKGLPCAEPQWIPVSERLPDIGEHYVSEPCLCYCSNGAYCFGELQENLFGQVGWDCERDDEYHEAIGEVVAWMPLPKVYRGEDDE